MNYIYSYYLEMMIPSEFEYEKCIFVWNEKDLCYYDKESDESYISLEYVLKHC